MPEPINLTKVGPVVDLTFVGECHLEDNKLIIGDTDVVKRFAAAYGGNRQLSELRVTLHLLTSPTIEVSPSGNGVFAEHSEP
jgi:hypothetical protein